jgi:hypothetical protein
MAKEWYNNLFGTGVNIFGAGMSPNVEAMKENGLLQQTDIDKAQNQSLMRGLLGTAVSYASQPRNKDYGSWIPYAGKAFQAGMDMADDPLNSLPEDAMAREKILKYKEEKEAEENMKNFAMGLGQRNPNATRTTQKSIPVDPKYLDSNGNQIAPDYNAQSAVQEEYFDKVKYLDEALANGTIDLDTYSKYLPEAPESVVTSKGAVRTTPDGKIIVDNREPVAPPKQLTATEKLDLTPAQLKEDESFGTAILEEDKKLLTYKKDEADLKDAMRVLGSGQGTGKWIGVKDALGILSFTDPQAKATYDRVTGIVQRTLRETLGAQFTEKEAALLIGRAYDTALSPQENAKRVSSLLAQITNINDARQSKVDYYRTNGTLKGYQSPAINTSAQAIYDQYTPKDYVMGSLDEQIKEAESQVSNSNWSISF